MKAYRQACGWTFTAHKPAGWRALPVTLDVLYASNKNSAGYRARDTMNAIGALKPLIDGLVDSGIVPSDSAAWVKWGALELKTRVEPGLRDGVYVTVRLS